MSHMSTTKAKAGTGGGGNGTMCSGGRLVGVAGETVYEGVCEGQ